MFDKRVVRGNTWALRRLAKSNDAELEQQERKRMKQKRNLIRKQIQTKYNPETKIFNQTLPTAPTIPSKGQCCFTLKHSEMQ